MLRPHELPRAVDIFVRETLGEAYLESPPFPLSALYAESDWTVPLLLISAPGSEPTAPLLELARLRGFEPPLGCKA